MSTLAFPSETVPSSVLAPETLTAETLAPISRPLASEHPPSVYLASLAFGSRRAMTQALDTTAQLLTGGRCNADTLLG